MHADLSLRKAVLKQYLETEMIDGRRMRHGPLRLFVSIAGAKLNLICLPQKLVADLASAPKLCFQNFSSRRGVGNEGGEGKKMMNPFLQGRLEMDVFLTPFRLWRGAG